MAEPSQSESPIVCGRRNPAPATPRPRHPLPEPANGWVHGGSEPLDWCEHLASLDDAEGCPKGWSSRSPVVTKGQSRHHDFAGRHATDFGSLSPGSCRSGRMPTTAALGQKQTHAPQQLTSYPTPHSRDVVVIAPAATLSQSEPAGNSPTKIPAPTTPKLTSSMPCAL